MNLKEAASRLGVHYQTAYRWVRSGDLVAVRVGGRYEISRAAIERLRQTQQHRATFTVEPRPVPSSLEDELLQLADGPRVDVAHASTHLARRLAEATGDLCAVGILNRERSRIETATCFDPDPSGSPLVTGAIAATMRLRRPDEGVIMRQVFAGESLFVPHVPQEMVRAWVPRPFHQIFDEASIFGVVASPIVIDDAPRAGIGLFRLQGERPFTVADADRIDHLSALAAPIVAGALADTEARATLVATAEAVAVLDPAQRRAAATRLLRHQAAPVMVRDGEGAVLAATPAYAALLDDDLLPSIERLRSGELDFSYDTVTGPSGRVVVHHEAVRNIDTTLEAIVSVARPVMATPDVTARERRAG